MNLHDKPGFQALLADVLGFYGKSVSPFAISVWWEACREMDLESVRAAMTAHATDPQRGHFAPMPADVIRHVHGSVSDRAAEAWIGVLRQVRSVGSYGSPELDEGQREALEAIGGWGALCSSEESQLAFLQRRFVEAYQTLSARASRLAIANPGPLKLAS